MRRGHIEPDGRLQNAVVASVKSGDYAFDKPRIAIATRTVAPAQVKAANRVEFAYPRRSKNQANSDGKSRMQSIKRPPTGRDSSAAKLTPVSSPVYTSPAS